MTDIPNFDSMEISTQHLAEVEGRQLADKGVGDIIEAIRGMTPQDWASDKPAFVELDLIPGSHRARPGVELDSPEHTRRTMATTLDLLHSKLEGGDRVSATTTDNGTVFYWTGQVARGRTLRREVFIEEKAWKDESGAEWLKAKAHLKMPKAYAKLLAKQASVQTVAEFEAAQEAATTVKVSSSRLGRIVQRIGKAGAAYMDKAMEPRPRRPDI